MKGLVGRRGVYGGGIKLFERCFFQGNHVIRYILNRCS